MRLMEKEVVGEIRRLQLRELRQWVRAGWVRPAASDNGPLFDEVDVARLRLICDLKKEMGLPADAVPTILALLDQVHGLRRELRALAEAVDAQPGKAREAVLAIYRRRSGGGAGGPGGDV